MQLVVGGLGTATLACLGWWWWAPVPLAASFLLYEAIFATRADKPVVLELSPSRATIRDPFVDAVREVDLEAITAVTLVYRDAPEGDGVDAVVVLSSPEAVLLAVQMQLDRATFAPRPHDVDADLMNAVLGSISGLIRALAPREALVRQRFEDPVLLEWLRERFPASTWERTALRGWTGAEPELDVFGYHSQPADRILELGDPPAVADPTRSERIAVIFRMFGEEHQETGERLPMWIQPVGDLRIAIPAPLVDPDLPEVPLTDDLVHVHPPEGAILLWHLWRKIPRERWPAAWSEALRHARPTLKRWPEGIPAPD